MNQIKKILKKCDYESMRVNRFLIIRDEESCKTRHHIFQGVPTRTEGGDGDE